MHLLVIQVSGEKLVVIFDSKYTAGLYPCDGVPNASQVDPKRADCGTRWPEFGAVQQYGQVCTCFISCTLEFLFCLSSRGSLL